MKVGFCFANILEFGTPEGARTLVKGIEDAGLESVWTVEHTVVPKDYASPYPYSKDGKMPGGETSPIPDPLIWLTWAAAHTTKIRLATGILILPQRNPVVLAKELATLDTLSGGRVTLGVGIGWLKEEFDAIGVDFSRRVSRTEESISALRALWSADETFKGKHFNFADARSYPKPSQGSIPIHVGGHSEGAAQRAGRLGDGFFPNGKNTPELIKIARQAAEDAGRDPDALEVTSWGRPILEDAERLAAAGVHRMLIRPLSFNPAECADELMKISGFVKSVGEM